MEKELFLNDQIKYKCIIENNNISFEFDKNLSFLNRFITKTKRDNTTFVSIGMKQILIIRNNEITKVLPISTTEIRILRAYYNHFISRSEDLISLFRESKEKIMRNLKSLNKKKWDNRQILKTELHTHLIEILNAKELIDYVNTYNIKYPINDRGELDFNSEYFYSYNELDQNIINNLERSLSIDYKVSNFDDLEKAVENRNQLMQRVIQVILDGLPYDKEWIKQDSIIKEKLDLLNIKMNELNIQLLNSKSKKEKNDINLEKMEVNNQIVKCKDSDKTYAGYVAYDGLFSRCLDKLSKENVTYSEISYSNDTRIKYLSNKYKENTNFKFLYSIDRTKNVKAFSNAARCLEPLLNENNVIGLDIMGNEHLLEGDEYSNFKEKLEWILPVLHIHPNSVLRIHAGEFKDSTMNVLNALKAIRETANKINDCCSDLFGESWGVIPPPRIRIGHGVNIEKNDELIHVIKEFDAVIEFNISSNYAFGHVDDLSGLPIKFYDDNDIKYVFATDGGGMYSTSLHQEQNLVNSLQTSNSSPTRQVVETDFVAKASETEKEIIKENNNTHVSEKDKNLMNKFLEHKNSNFKFKEYDNFDVALESENSIFMLDGKELNESEKINSELFKIKRFITDNDMDIDMNYFNTKIDIIDKYRRDKNLSEYAKMYLYLLEDELFNDMDSSFKSIEYLYNMDTPKNRIEEYLKRVLNLVSEQYVNDTKYYYNKNNKNKMR